jgi:hypothetical protein
MLAFATLLHLQAPFHDLLVIVAEWLSGRTGQVWNAQQVLEAELWRYPESDVRTAQARVSEQMVWGLQVVSRDRRTPSRDWRLELTLRDLEQGGAQATVVVHALENQRVGHSASVPFSQPALVRALLARGNPDADTAGLQPFSIDTEADAQCLVDRIGAPNRSRSVLVLNRGEATLDVPGLRAAMIGMAELVELRPVLSQEVAAVLKPASAWPPPARAIHFPSRKAEPVVGGREQRLLLAADTRALASSVLTFGAPRVLAEHLSVERLQSLNRPSPSGDDAV